MTVEMGGEVASLHDELVVIDGLQVGGDWPSSLFEELRAGGLTAIHTTFVLWEDAKGALDDIGRWQRRFREHSDLILPVLSGADILRAKTEGKTGIIYGFQNASPFEDSLDYVEIFHRLGVRTAQLTYNNQNLIGSSCYEEHDSGLSRFGRRVIAEMNRLGMVIDLSHVGDQTSIDVFRHSTRPVAITHGNPAFVHPHKRNKSNEILSLLAEHDGVIGLTPYPNLTGPGLTIEAWCDIVARTADLVGVDHVGIGSDYARGWTDVAGHIRWTRMGRWTHDVDWGAGSPEQGWQYPAFPDWLQTSADFPNLTAGLLASGFGEDDVRKIMGGNWLRFYEQAL